MLAFMQQRAEAVLLGSLQAEVGGWFEVEKLKALLEVVVEKLKALLEAVGLAALLEVMRAMLLQVVVTLPKIVVILVTVLFIQQEYQLVVHFFNLVSQVKLQVYFV